MQTNSRQVYFLSNGTAITAETLGLSLLAQFPDHSFQTHTIPFVDSLEKAHSVVDEINRCIDSGRQFILCGITMACRNCNRVLSKLLD